MYSHDTKLSVWCFLFGLLGSIACKETHPENLRRKQQTVTKHCDNQTTWAEKMFRRDIWLNMLAHFLVDLFPILLLSQHNPSLSPSLFYKPICLHLLFQPSVTIELFTSQVCEDDEVSSIPPNLAETGLPRSGGPVLRKM